MLIVAGNIVVDPDQRARYVAGCAEVVEADAPSADDFATARRSQST